MESVIRVMKLGAPRTRVYEEGESNKGMGKSPTAGQGVEGDGEVRLGADSYGVSLKPRQRT